MTLQTAHMVRDVFSVHMDYMNQWNHGQWRLTQWLYFIMTLHTCKNPWLEFTYSHPAPDIRNVFQKTHRLWPMPMPFQFELDELWPHFHMGWQKAQVVMSDRVHVYSQQWAFRRCLLLSTTCTLQVLVWSSTAGLSTGPHTPLTASGRPRAGQTRQ